MPGMRRTTTLSLLGLLVWSPAALAQDPIAVPGEEEAAQPEPEFTEVVEEPTPARGSDGDGGHASGASRGLGVGAMALLGAAEAGGILTGPAVVYDFGQFHAEAVFAFDSGGEDAFGLGARFWYHLHGSRRADLSVGGGLGMASIDQGGGQEDLSVLDVEGGALVRYFVVDNVSLSAALGFVVLGADADEMHLRGDLVGRGGIVYFF
jgi:hypothetical protein